MNTIWTALDKITIDEEGIGASKDEVVCDICFTEIVAYPFYSVKNGRNSLDFCKPCFDTKEITFTTKPSPRIVIRSCCFVCEKEVDSTLPFKVSIASNSWFYVCEKCSHIQTNYNSFIKSICEKVVEPRGVVARQQPEIIINVHTVQRAISAKIKTQLTEERTEKWVALIEDICHLPRLFGSVKQWTIFTDELDVPPFKTADLRAYLLVDCSIETGGRISALVLDSLCCARIYLLCSTLQKYREYVGKWKQYKKNMSYSEYRKIIQKIHVNVEQRKYNKLIKKYIGLFI